MADEEATEPSPVSERNILMMRQTSKQGTPKRLNFNSTNLSSLNASTSDKTIAKKDVVEWSKNDSIDQYLNALPPSIAAAKFPCKTNDNFKVPAQPQAKAQEQPEPESTLQSNDSELYSESELIPSNMVKFLANMIVMFRKFDSESHRILTKYCKAAGAEVIEDDYYTGLLNFLILPIDAMSMEGITVKAKEIVNHNWVVSELKMRSLKLFVLILVIFPHQVSAKRLHEFSVGPTKAAPFSEFPYYYRPILFPEELFPLANMVIVISIYSSDERLYLEQMAKILGADFEERFIRQQNPYLICPEPKSPQYDAAIRWSKIV